jgi:formylglycine-generating enzyme required for sulfatase activity
VADSEPVQDALWVVRVIRQVLPAVEVQQRHVLVVGSRRTVQRDCERALPTDHEWELAGLEDPGDPRQGVGQDLQDLAQVVWLPLGRVWPPPDDRAVAMVVYLEPGIA